MRSFIAAVLVLLSLAPLASAEEVPPPEYGELLLDGMFPAGGKAGQSVTVEIWGVPADRKGKKLVGLQGARGLIIDGPPGITVREIKNLSDTRVSAVLDIAADAQPGRRMVRVHCDRVGATSGTWFIVGNLPETTEGVKNDTPATAPVVETPVVVNGRVEEPLDVDCVRFRARKGQKIVAAVNCHGIDRNSRGRALIGFIDTSLELLGPDGSVVADAQDTVGLDPIIEYTVPQDGEYATRVFLVGYLGGPEAVYRLTLGEVAYPTALFPAGGKRGAAIELTASGVNVPAANSFRFQVPNDSLPVTWLVPPGGHHEVPFVLGDLNEAVEQEPNDARDKASSATVGSTINGRFDTAGDEDWYRLDLAAGQRIKVDVVAQRYLREGIDTLVEVFDAKGEHVASNDDIALGDVEVLHDFEPFDSGLSLDPKSAGVYYVRLSEQSGAFGPRAAYRLTIYEPTPEFAVHQWPDAVPIWGPGSTAAFVATVDRQAVIGAKDVELSVEGLPPGWKGSKGISLANKPGQTPHAFGKRVFLTITAPADAAVGTVANFRVVGRVTVGDKTIERVAQPLSVYYPTDRTYGRWSRQSRAIVAASQGPYLKTNVETLTVIEGTNSELPVEIVGMAGDGKHKLVANIARSGIQCVLGVSQLANVVGGKTVFPLTTDALPVGTHALVVARAWDSETRKGMPGPCTPIVQLNIVPRNTTTAAK